MRCAIITVAGVSSRFNRNIPEEQHVLKAIYHRGDPSQTLLYQLLLKCSYADRIIVVGGYRFDDLEAFCSRTEAVRPAYGGDQTEPVPAEKRDTNAVTAQTPWQGKLQLVYNESYAELASGYSLSLGITAAHNAGATEIVFAEGDLDVDDASFYRVVQAKGSVLTCNREPVYANKTVVLYQNAEGHYRYAFNAAHGLLTVDEPFSCLLNSGQIWKFTDMNALQQANEAFLRERKDGTNLYLIQRYLDAGIPCELVCFDRWTNCNTREDYRHIVAGWRGT